MKLTLITLITLLLCATAPAQDSIQNQLNQIEQNQQDAQAYLDAAAAEARAQAEQREAWERFRDCVNHSGMSPADCARAWLPNQ